MGASKPQSFALAFVQGRNINAADVIALLREVYADGIATRDEAEELIAFDHSLASATPGWRDFFAATVADHVLQRQEPAGFVDKGKAEWLVGALAHGRRIATVGGFAAVLRLIEIAPETPPVLAAYAIDQLRVAVIAGEGPAIGKRAHYSRMIDGEDVALLARILVAAGGDAGHAVSRAEAEALFDLHDAVAGGASDPAFDDLFFKAIANHLMSALSVKVAPRRDVLAPAATIAER
ncbi:MAG: hypothetical protein WD207_02715, partial [Xanthobacteraceae bacterium]